ncbi:2Fe-2S iron-sulfur cluster binding domain-containing protein [Aromatoleum toluvorans]|uniref:2Fe-2S iron-sulfur cluster binding domain-containing protein n=1 Tax=Aromatoleum toluvorans TaxID=92002 RepID=A0ABX1Q5M9_9RHOO|nr:2Fe-2S iron-sulfur cluster-binding protein [Aromatoleum toluvorans]NMG46077.1 2Fe-2S iron-sulfur cluster binding domain-containing protein [Aromatoleum toluvorans]
MTSLTLFMWIAFGIAVQFAIFLAVTFWQHWKKYTALRLRSDPDEPVQPQDPAPAANDAGGASWAGFRPFRVVRKEIEDEAGSVCSFYLEPEDKRPLPPFLPGQFLTFRLEVPAPAGGTEEIVRCYSLSDAPRADLYRVSIKRVPAPPGSALPAGRSSNHFHDHVSLGSRLMVRAPSGHFHIDRSDAPVVLIAGGIGITPMLSMANWCVAEQPGRELWLFYGVRDARETVMLPHLCALAEQHPNIHLRVCVSNPGTEPESGSTYVRRGRVDVGLLRMELPLKPYHFYICGPTPMMESLVPALEDWGVPDSHIHFEAFGPASIKRRAQSAPASVVPEGSAAGTGLAVTFGKSGKTLAWNAGGGSLLELAEAGGVNIPSGCRAGSCGTCQTKIESGEVSYRQEPDFDPEPGTCLLCVCVPKTAVTLGA